MEIFIISDTHFGHSNMLSFKNYDGSLLRPFSSVEEMDELMVENWNKRVKPQDKVYHLGDVAMSKKALPILSRLNGHKSLVAGNHDIFDSKIYLKYFENIRACKVLDNYILTHIPIHPESIERYSGNIHGHLHGNVLEDIRYFSVCVEQINYTPISFGEAKEYFVKKIRER